MYPFHALRHSAVTNVYRRTRDLFLAQRFARHVSPLRKRTRFCPAELEPAEKLNDCVVDSYKGWGHRTAALSGCQLLRPVRDVVGLKT